MRKVTVQWGERDINGFINIFCIGPGSKYVRLSGPYMVPMNNLL